MILNVILRLLSNFINAIIDLLPVLPSLSSDIINIIDSVFDYIYSSVDLINVFIPIPLCMTLLTMVLSLMVFKYTWAILDWVLRHIPVFGTH